MNQLHEIEFNKVRSTTEIFEDFWNFIKEEWRQYFLLMSVAVLPFLMIQAYFMTQMAADGFLDAVEMEKSMNSLLVAALMAFLAKFAAIFVTSSYIISYRNGKTLDFDGLKSMLSTHGLRALGATAVMMVLLSLGFICFFIPGVILLPPLSILVYDVIVSGLPTFTCLSRCINLCKTNWRQSFGVVLICYAALLTVSWFVGYVPVGETASIFVASFFSMVSESVVIPFILMYYSLANQNLQL